MYAPYAARPEETRGRLYPEEESEFRSCYQRDRDRIIHSSAFLRLKHKTQVFVENEGDYFRTRLTHSIEVAQVARTVGGALGLNTELVEAVALAHDLGHTPFGHTGEDALNEVMADFGGFDHNAQTMRIVTHLERHYADFDGLNLTWDCLEGIAKHNGPVIKDVPQILVAYDAIHDLELNTHASAEAQVAALSDDIAYNSHDFHDGLRAGLFSVEDVMQLPILGRCFDEVDARYSELDPKRRWHEGMRRYFGVLVGDVIRTSRNNIRDLHPHSIDDIRGAGRMMVSFSPQVTEELHEIHRFLFDRMYRAPSVVKTRQEVAEVVRRLFAYLMENPQQLPQMWEHDIASAQDDHARARLICDYLSGMTDRYALLAHEQFGLGSVNIAPHGRNENMW